MICTATNRTYVTHVTAKVSAPQEKKTAAQIFAEQFAAVEARRALAMAALTEPQRAAYPSLSIADKLYVDEHGKWPTGKVGKLSNVPKQLGGVRPCVLNGVEYPSRVEGARALGISEDAFRALVRKAEAKDDAPVMTLAEVLAVLGSFEMTVEKIYRTQNTGHGPKVISAALERAVSEGLVEKRHCGKVTRYKAVRHVA